MRTIKIHSKDNLNYLSQLEASGAEQKAVDLVKACGDELTQLLDSIAEESQSSGQSASGSPYPDGEYLLFDA
jgi:hypothetical protein